MHSLLSRSTLLATLVALALPAVLNAQPAPAPAPAPAAAPVADPIHDELAALISKVQAKLQSGQVSETALAPELKQFDDLRVKHAGDKSESVAWIGIMEARLYIEVLNNSTKGAAILKEVAATQTGTPLGKQLDGVVAALEQKAAADARFGVGKPFPTFSEKDLNGAALDLASYKGKIVLVDFWATWCPPCRAELPNVIAAYQKYHSQGFEIVGISLDQDRDKLTSFIKDHGMTWAQYFDGQGWHNKLAEADGIQSIPATFLLDGNGNIVARDLRGPALEAKLAELLPAKN